MGYTRGRPERLGRVAKRAARHLSPPSTAPDGRRTENRIAKGTIAGLIGIALLLGGAGTFAYWNTSATVGTGTLTAGTLALAANSDGIWKDGTTTIDPTTYRIIPGKTLTYTQTLTVTATGNDLSATMSVPALVGSGTLNGIVTQTLSVTSTSSNVTVSGNTITVASAATPGTLTATVTVAFPATATTGQLGTLSLSNVALTLTQQ